MRTDRARRSLFRAVLCVALALAAVLAPVPSANLPGELDHIAPEAPVMAQNSPSGVVRGRGAGCPPTVISLPRNQQTSIPWTIVGSDCVLDTDACPPSPVTVDGFLVPSMDNSAAEQDINGQAISRYPGFCEERVAHVWDPVNLTLDSTLYNDCTVTTGFVVMEHDMEPALDQNGLQVFDSGGNPIILRMCRMIHPPECLAGLHRISSNHCRAVRRANWTCPGTSIPRNDYLTCYDEAPTPSGTHPACGAGSPDFVAQDCEDYVSNDYVRNPGSVDCTAAATFDTGGSTTLAAVSPVTSSSIYWCAFDVSYLKVVCHSAAPPAAECGAQQAQCLKRASGTGGCNAIAETIRCREQQANHRDDPLTFPVEVVRAANCEPCIVLPFEPVPTSCAPDLINQPTVPVSHTSHDLLHELRRNLRLGANECARLRQQLSLGMELDPTDQDYQDCIAYSVCDGAPTGNLTWKSAHNSGLAVVNAPVILTISGVNRAELGIPQLSLTGNPLSISNAQHTYLRYDDDGPGNNNDDVLGDPVLRFWPPMDPTVTYDSVTDWIPLLEWGECLARAGERPRFRVRIEELHPDDDPVQPAVTGQADEIRDLFGQHALAWWANLSADEQRHRIESRGFVFLGDPALSQAARDQELERRADADVELDCNVGAVAWCRWTPPRSGYFKVTGAGSWIIQHRVARYWAESVPSDTSMTVVATILSQSPLGLGAVQAFLDVRAITPAAVGLDGPLPASPNILNRPDPSNEWLYTDAAGPQHRCPGVDLRVRCARFSQAGNYKETESVGIVVHEMRVVTTRPNT